jgi:hydroxymethylpyrimidine/phosphomethylpyrimidine kinase
MNLPAPPAPATRPQPPVALTIAGSDSGGGAGIQADLKTFAALGVFGTSAITALTAQNTTGVRAIRPVDAQLVAAQIEAILADLPVRAVKTGMLATAETVALVGASAERLPNLVVDPVLVSSSGHRLFTGQAQRAYLDVLFPYAAVVTPNLREAGVLLDRTLSTVDDMVAAATALAGSGARCVVVKGGHLPDGPSRRQAVDVVWHDGRIELLREPWIDTPNNHGTGCTFAAATAARLARGDPLPVALRAAKSYVHRAIAGAAQWRIGAGHGPLSWEVPQ